MPKILEFESDARAALERGVDTLANTVRVTIGPRGRNVVIDKSWGAPTITNDGVTIAREIELSDPSENMGAQLVKEVATKTNDIAGDGTTTATVLAQSLVHEGLKMVTAGAAPGDIKKGMERASAAVVEQLLVDARQIRDENDTRQVATISSADPEVGDLIAEGFGRVGKDGVISVEDAPSMGVELEYTEGMQFGKGYISPYFITDTERMEAVLEEAQVLLVGAKIATVAELLPALELAMAAKRPLLIIAEDVEGEALSTLVVNRIRGTIDVAAVKSPAFGDRRKAMMQDIAILTGGQVVSEEIGLSLDQVTAEVLGSVRRVVITKDDTTIVDGRGEPAEIEERIAQIRREMDNTDSDWDREKLGERLAKLSGGVCVIRVGAATEVEMKERKHRIEDAVSATRAALEEGVVAGGGSALVHAGRAIDGLELDGDQAIGAAVVRRALVEPLRWIAENAGQSGYVITSKVAEAGLGIGYNADTGAFEDLVAAGVVDPVKVTRSALQNAVSIAGLLLTTEALVAEKPAEEPVSSGHGHGHSHGPGGHTH